LLIRPIAGNAVRFLEFPLPTAHSPLPSRPLRRKLLRALRGRHCFVLSANLPQSLADPFRAIPPSHCDTAFLNTWLQILAQQSATGRSSVSSAFEWDIPYTAGDWAILIGLLLTAVWAIVIARRDTRDLSRLWTVWLSLLRLGMIATLFVIALNPHIRTQRESFRPSQVAILVDTSTSMKQPATDVRPGTATPDRATVVREFFEKTPLLAELQKRHAIDVYTFDSDLNGPLYRFPWAGPGRSDPSGNEKAEALQPPQWGTWLQPARNSTALGDALDKVLAETKGKTLSGVIVVSDGASNVGRSPDTAIQRARQSGVKLIAIGVGGTTPPVDLSVARIVSPTDVAKGDAFELTAWVQSRGLTNQNVSVELLQRGPQDTTPIVVETKSVPAIEGTGPQEVQFSRTLTEAGAFEYTIRTVGSPDLIESRLDNNSESRTINVFDRPSKVLIIAGGPMRDYIFAKNLLFRHKSIDTDVWLQTGKIGISQDADNLLFKFPEKREDLFAYDVILAFDVDWTLVTPEQQQWIDEWVAGEGGGIAFIAGDAYTYLLSSEDEKWNKIRTLCPVIIDDSATGTTLRDSARQAFPIELTQDGQAADFLKLQDDPAAESVWASFSGFYRTQATRGRRGGVTVYAEFTDPLARGIDGPPPVIAGQRYGQGNSFYLGSPEFWRLRSASEEFYDRFWIKLTRKLAEGRSKRGLQRGMFVMDSREFDLGQTIPVRVRVLNEQFQPLSSPSFSVDVYDSQGRPLTPPLVLSQDRFRPAEYTGEFRADLSGRYRLEMEVPGLKDRLREDLQIRLPEREFAEMTQNVAVLSSLAEQTGGKYLTLDTAAETIPSLLPDQGEQIIVDQRIREVWDRGWVMGLLAGLLAIEWLTRKLLKLA
jgi:hypothetical protein